MQVKVDKEELMRLVGVVWMHRGSSHGGAYQERTVCNYCNAWKSDWDFSKEPFPHREDCVALIAQRIHQKYCDHQFHIFRMGVDRKKIKVDRHVCIRCGIAKELVKGSQTDVSGV